MSTGHITLDQFDKAVCDQVKPILAKYNVEVIGATDKGIIVKGELEATGFQSELRNVRPCPLFVSIDEA